MAKNTSLNAANKNKHDEFYTDISGIAREMEEYFMHNPDVFRGKSVLLPCDDPEKSNFTRYFVKNFKRLGLKHLISTSYNANGRGKFFMKRDDTDIDIDNIPYTLLEGDGDFRSQEVTEIRDNVDFVITNPPFSLLREFIHWCEEGGVKFSAVGPIIGAGYQQVLRLLIRDKIWRGATYYNMTYTVPDRPEYTSKNTVKRVGDKYRMKLDTLWYTNIPHGKNPKPLILDTMASNSRFNTSARKSTRAYKQYDDYAAIEVPATDAIPSDYDGVMGVPVSFMLQYNPEQFDILSVCDPKIDGEGIFKRLLIQRK